MIKLYQVLLGLSGILLLLSCSFTGFWALEAFTSRRSANGTIHPNIAEAYTELAANERANMHLWSMVDTGLVILMLIIGLFLLRSVRRRNRKWQESHPVSL